MANFCESADKFFERLTDQAPEPSAFEKAVARANIVIGVLLCLLTACVIVSVYPYFRGWLFGVGRPGGLIGTISLLAAGVFVWSVLFLFPGFSLLWQHTIRLLLFIWGFVSGNAALGVLSVIISGLTRRQDLISGLALAPQVAVFLVPVLILILSSFCLVVRGVRQWGSKEAVR